MSRIPTGPRPSALRTRSKRRNEPGSHDLVDTLVIVPGMTSPRNHPLGRRAIADEFLHATQDLEPEVVAAIVGVTRSTIGRWRLVGAPKRFLEVYRQRMLSYLGLSGVGYAAAPSSDRTRVGKFLSSPCDRDSS